MNKLFAIGIVFSLIVASTIPQAKAGGDPIALTFGRCVRSQASTGCPSPTNQDADGDSEFQKLMISCLAANTDHEFVTIGDNAIPEGLWLDLSIQPARLPSDKGKIELTGTLYQDKNTYVDGRLYLFSPTPETFRRVCDMYSDELEKAIMSLN